MNVRRVLEGIINDWEGAGFSIQEVDNEYGRVYANVSYAKLYGDRQFDINVHVYASGAIHVTFGLGVVHVTKKGYVLDLLNTFNIESSWFKGYCTDHDENYESLVELHFSMFEALTHEPDEKIVGDYAYFAIGRLLDEDMANMIEEILDELE